MNASFEAELSVLGAVFSSRSALDKCADVITASMFGDPKHQLIWTAMMKLDSEAKPIDVVSVGVALEAMGVNTQVGGLGYLAKLQMSVASSIGAEGHAGVVKDAHRTRQLKLAGAEVVRIASDASMDIEESLRAVDTLLATMLDVPTRGESIQYQAESARALAKELQDVANGIKPRRIPFGFNLSDLNLATCGGADPSCELILVGARSGHGKTALADQLADEIGRMGEGVVAYFSVEVAGHKLEMRRQARRSGVPMQDIKQWTFSQPGADDRVINQMHQVIRTSTEKLNAGVVTFSKGRIDVGYISRKVRQLCRRGKVAAVFVDYWQAIEIEGNFKDGRMKLDAIAGALKAIQLENGVAMFVCAQLNRSERGPVKRPTYRDIRGSDRLYHDSSIALLLHRPAAENQDLVHTDKRTEDMEIIVAKNREGPTFNMEMLHQPDCGRFWSQHFGWKRLGDAP